MAREEVRLVQRLFAREVDPAGLHERQGPGDLVGDLGVALALCGRRDELLVPDVDAREVREAALRERAQQVERGDGLLVGADQAPGVRTARVDVERLVVDHVAAEALELDAVDGLELLGSRLGELARDPPKLHDRHARRVGEHDGHLQDQLQLVADRVGRDVVERLGAVARLQQEGTPLGHRAELLGQGAGLAGEHERREGCQPRLSLLQLVGVRPGRLLCGGLRAPGPGLPARLRRRAHG